jgi:peptidoglycan/xylan/chitin deacetylase (PgdA/CDA1 family)
MTRKIFRQARQFGMIIFLMNVMSLGYTVTMNQSVCAHIHANGDGEGILLYNFSTNTGWANGSSGLNATNITFCTEGNSSLSITAQGGISYWLWRTCLWNFSTAQNIDIDIYCPNASAVSQLGIYFSSESNTSWTKQARIGLRSYLDTGWNRLSLNKSAFVLENGETWDSTMMKFSVLLDPLASTATILIDNLRMNYTGFPKVIITHDGNYFGIDSLAEPILDYYGFDCVRFVENYTIGNTGQTTLENLTRQYNKGWDISNHGERHLDTVTLNATALDREVNLCYFWLMEHGFTRSAKFYCYPFGHYNDAVVTTVMDHHVMARDSTTGRYEKHYTTAELGSRRMYQLKGVTVTNGTTLATVAAAINSSLSTNGILVLIFHSLSTTSGALPANYWNATSYNKTIGLLKTYQTAERLEVVTLSDYYGELTSEPPSNNTIIIDSDKISEKTPGFGLFLLLCALAVSLFIRKKK